MPVDYAIWPVSEAPGSLTPSDFFEASGQAIIGASFRLPRESVPELNLERKSRRIKEQRMFGRSAQSKWKKKTLKYVELVNAFVERGHREGWENMGDEPKDPGREHLAADALEAVRKANAGGNLDELREKWPPAHAPLIPLLEDNGQHLPVVCVLDDGSIVARVGSWYEGGRTVQIADGEVTEVPDVGYFGRGPQRRFFGVAREDGITILDGWQGPEVALCPWPTGQEGVPAGIAPQSWDGPLVPSRIVPFPDGERVLVASSEGIFVLTASKAHRLLPTETDLKKHFEWLRENHPGDDLTCDLSMEHAAISRDGKWIAVGSQDSTHLVFDQKYGLAADVGNQDSYPHHAAFSADQSLVAFNSCHFYNGSTLGVPTTLLPGLRTPPFEEDERLRTLEEGSRVYAAASRNDELIFGDAYGYLRCVSLDGERRWEQFIGSTIGDIDVTPDGRTMVASSYAGFLSIFDLDAGHQSPHQIGTGGHRERRRWLFWKNEPEPLRW